MTFDENYEYQIENLIIESDFILNSNIISIDSIQNLSDSSQIVLTTQDYKIHFLECKY